MTTPQSYYRALGDGRFESTIHAQGAWNPQEQHMAPATGILAHCLERCSPRDDLRFARLSFDILGMIHAGEFEVTTEVIRPGRTIELLRAELISQGRPAIRAHAWRLQTQDTSAVAGLEDTPMAGVAHAEATTGLDAWPGGFIDSLEGRELPGHRPGRGQVWLRNGLDMVEGEETSDFVRLMGMVDASNGIATRVSPEPGSYLFPNVDLQIHLHRAPAGQWLGLDNKVTFGADGIGLTSSVLNDEQGPFGRAEQILTIRPRPEQN